MTTFLGYPALDREGNSVMWFPYSPCPCTCAVIAGKLTKRGHAVGCLCKPCLGTRSQRKGKRGQANAHKILGGTGFTPSNEESGRAYSVEHRIEAKTGGQVPATFVKFLDLDWTRRAFSQAERGTPVGEQSFPSVYMELPGGGCYLVTELRPRRSKAS